MQPNRTEQRYNRGMTGQGHLAPRPRQFDPALIKARLDHAEEERRRKAFCRMEMIVRGMVLYHPVHHTNLVARVGPLKAKNPYG